MKYCPYCGTEVINGAVSYCFECGKKLPVAGQAALATEMADIPAKSRHKCTRQKRPKFLKEKPPKQEKAPKKEKSPKKEKLTRKQKIKKKKPEKKIPQPMGALVDDGYDGYYDDVLPPDVDRVKDGVDKDLVKKIIILGAGVTIVISMCVLLLYFV